MRFSLIDIKTPDQKVNREHAGGFGAAMRANGIAGHIVKTLKENLIHLPVLNLAYTAALLRKAGHEVVISHGRHEETDIALIATSMCAHKKELAYAQELKTKYPHCKVGYLGALPTTRPKLFEKADFIVRGEIEATILSFLRGEHNFSGTLNHGIVEDLTELPAPDWTGFKPQTFTYFPLLDKRPMLPVQSSRGCAHACSYCSYMPVQTSHYRRRNPLDVVEEMANGIRLFKARSFLFRDICFTLNRKHVLEIITGIKSNLPPIEWACETRVDCLDKELVDLMWESGFRGVNLGIESPNEEILIQSGKKAPNFQHQMEIVQYMIDKGVRINAFYMLGLVGDTPQSMQRTIKFAENLNTLGAQYCILTPFPGIPLYDELKDRLLTKDFSQYNEFTPVVDIETASPKEIEHALSRACQYYFRAAWMIKYAPATALRAARNILGGILKRTK